MEILTTEKIREWLETGKKKDATHVIVVCDTFDYGHYPVYAFHENEARDRFANPGSMQRPMEVYNISLPWEPQLAKRPRNFVF